MKYFSLDNPSQLPKNLTTLYPNQIKNLCFAYLKKDNLLKDLDLQKAKTLRLEALLNILQEEFCQKFIKQVDAKDAKIPEWLISGWIVEDDNGKFLFIDDQESLHYENWKECLADLYHYYGSFLYTKNADIHYVLKDSSTQKIIDFDDYQKLIHHYAENLPRKTTPKSQVTKSDSLLKFLEFNAKNIFWFSVIFQQLTTSFASSQTNTIYLNNTNPNNDYRIAVIPGTKPYENLGYAKFINPIYKNNKYPILALSGDYYSNETTARNTYFINGDRQKIENDFDLLKLNGENGFTIDSGNILAFGARGIGDLQGNGREALGFGGSHNDSDSKSGGCVILPPNKPIPAKSKLHDFMHPSLGFHITDVEKQDSQDFTSLRNLGKIYGDKTDAIGVVVPRSSLCENYVIRSQQFNHEFSVKILNGRNGFIIGLKNCDGKFALTRLNSVGDFNSDGCPDFGVSVTSVSDPNLSDSLCVIFGKCIRGLYPRKIFVDDLQGNGVCFVGDTAGLTGFTFIAVDLQGNNKPLLAIGAPGNQKQSGEVYLFYPRIGPFDDRETISSILRDPKKALKIIRTTNRNNPLDKTGYALSSGGIDKNGREALLISSLTSDGKDSAVYLLKGMAEFNNQTIVLDELEREQGLKFVGPPEAINLGVSVSGGFDLDQDGNPDITIGASFASPKGRQQAGQIYVLYGQGDTKNNLNWIPLFLGLNALGGSIIFFFGLFLMKFCGMAKENKIDVCGLKKFSLFAGKGSVEQNTENIELLEHRV